MFKPKFFIMKHLKIATALFLVSTSWQTYAQKTASWVLKNPIAAERPKELLVFTRKQLSAKLGAIPSKSYVTFALPSKQPILAQYDDLNGDGLWDEVALLQSFNASESKTILARISDKPATIKAAVLAHVRHQRKNNDDSFADPLDEDTVLGTQAATDFSKQPLPPFLTEGPAWENDKVGFRIYFDTRNAKDIWGKTTPRMILSEVGLNPAESYHKQAEWGMDVLKVGKSLGAGSLALAIQDEQGKEQLVRLGGGNFKQVQYKKIANGPIRAIFKLTYHDWTIANNMTPIQVSEEISIWGGQYFYESKVVLKNAPKSAKLVTGIVNLHSQQSYQLASKTAKVLYTFDKQSENNDNLGMAVLVPTKSYLAFGQTPNQGADIQNTYTVTEKLVASKPNYFRFFAGWEKSEPLFQTKNGFETFLQQQAALYDQPIQVR